MNDTHEHYVQLAGLFSYPEANYVEDVVKIQAFLDESCAEAAEQLKGFTEVASQISQLDLEELYTRSFDVQAITTLDIGYVLFGDDYKRGELLVKLNAEHKEAGVDCGVELADHLPNILRLLNAMQKPELRDELVQKIIAPALRKIISEFKPDNVEKKNATYKKEFKTLIERSEQYGVIYQKPLRALFTVMEQDFDVSEIETPNQTKHQQSCFLSSIKTEMTLDCNKGGRCGSIE
jgi:nitrate reductase molybdenum cofactor assembly chaperone